VMAARNGNLMAISGETYKQIGQASAGAVSIVTALDRVTHAVTGLTVTSFITLSFEPPLVMFAIQHDANCYPAMVASKSFGVSLLGVHQSEIARRFAAKGADKIAGTRFDAGHALGVPLIAEALVQIECLTNQIFISGDHAIVVGLVEAARAREGEPLLYFARKFGSFAPLRNE
jgi:flavin reductase (DIM6/NTAB) family NADH-FMN oxidoreductase RutF